MPFGSRILKRDMVRRSPDDDRRTPNPTSRQDSATRVLHSDPTNPYVTSPSAPDLRRLETQVREIARAAPPDDPPGISVIWNDNYYWPLPWYLRSFDQVSYLKAPPPHITQRIIISAPHHDAALTEQLGDGYLMIGYFGVRHNVLAQVWVRYDLWEAHLKRLGRI